MLRRGRVLGWCAAAWLVAAPAAPYRFYSPSDARLIVASDEAVRWDTGDFPLRYHLQDNIPDYLDEREWRDIVEDSLREWSGVPTADIRLSLEPGLVEGDGADSRDELAIGWVSPEEEGATFSGRALFWHSASGRMLHCDIEMNADRFRTWLDEGLERASVVAWMRTVVVHEIGHCLGLAHTEPHPIPGWLEHVQERPPPIPSGFLPETVMSYGYSRRAETSNDEETAVSLLYPARRFAPSRGAVSGRIVGEAGGASVAYVQAVYPGVRPRMGPGAFADEDGRFHLEGLESGTVILWLHPILIHGSNAHGELLAMAFEGGGLDVLDQWQWVSVAPRETIRTPDFLVARGRTR